MPIVSDIAGKVFIAGEYGVLAGGPAVVAAIAPRFVLSDDDSGGVPLGDMAHASPVGRLLGSASECGNTGFLRFRDAHFGAGGFGASTAQFALASEALRPGLSTEAIWRSYRELHADDPVPPSGVDLFAQLQGGVQHWVGEGRSRAIQFHFERAFEICILAAGHQSGRKVPTHEHLPRLQEVAEGRAPWLPELNALVATVALEMESRDGHRLGAAIQSVGDLFRREGLELEATSRDCAALGALPQVLGIKGAGALQADALVAVVERSGVQAFVEAATRRDLRYLGTLRDYEPGIRVFHSFEAGKKG